MATNTTLTNPQSDPSPASAGAARLALQPRDLRLLTDLLEDRLLRTSEIASLHFGNLSTAQKRLAKLWKAGLVRREFLPIRRGEGAAQAVYMPNDKTVSMLSARAQLVEWNRKYNYSTPQKKAHEIACNEIKVALVQAVKGRPDAGLIRFANCSSRQFYDSVSDTRWEGRGEKLPVRPDRFMILRVGTRIEPWFLEYDAGTEDLRRIENKAVAYRAYWYSGRYTEKYRWQNGNSMPPFRVLFITTTPDRRNHFVQKFIGLGSLRMMWATTKKDLLDDPLGPVCLRGMEYRGAPSKEEAGLIPIKKSILD